MRRLVSGCIETDHNVWVCRGPALREVRRVPDEVRWCFNCRKHLPHDWVVLDSDEPSYYEPIGRRDCPSCHGDFTSFPGREPFYE